MSILAIWAMICLAVALILFVMELFIPSGGLIGLLAGASCVTGIVLLFKIDTTIGLIGALITVISVPFFLAAAIHLWPSTPIARMLTLKNQSRPTGQSGSAHGSDSSTSGGGGDLLHATGKAVTDLRPVGTCVIGGVRIECLAETGVIKSGQEVRVVLVDGMTIKVRAIESV